MGVLRYCALRSCLNPIPRCRRALLITEEANPGPQHKKTLLQCLLQLVRRHIAPTSRQLAAAEAAPPARRLFAANALPCSLSCGASFFMTVLPMLQAERHGVTCKGRVIQVADGVVTARLEVFVSLHAVASWRQSPAAAQLFTHMRPLSEHTDGRGSDDAAAPRERSYFEVLREAAGPKAGQAAGPDAFT